MDDAEYAEIEEFAERQGETVSQWVRAVLRTARAEQPRQKQARKLAAIRNALTHEFPSGDIEQILEETERGYLA